MSAALDARAEVAKLARLLGADEGRFEGLAALPVEDLRTLRDQVTDVLYDSDSAALKRAAAGARVIPGAVAATISEKAFGPVLCARIAGMVDTGRAVDVAKRLPIPFLADVAVAMDPRRAVDVIGAIPTDHIVAVAAELGRRDEHVTMGSFVGHLDDAAIYACFAVLDDADLLRTGFLMDDKQRLDTVIGLLPQERLEGIVAAAHEHQLWAQAIDLLEHLSAEHHGRFTEAIMAQDDERLSAMLDVAAAEDLWPVLGPFARGLDDEVRARLLAIGGDRIPEDLR